MAQTLFKKIWLAILAGALVLAVVRSKADDVPSDDDVDEPGEEFAVEDTPVEAPNQDSESVPGVSLGSPTYGGTGCPQGTVSTTLSPDLRTLSVLFDSYLAEAGGDVAPKEVRLRCSVKIPVQVPAGYRVQVVKIDYRGFVSAPKGSVGVVGAGYIYSSEENPKTVSPRRFKKRFKGPREKNFLLSSVVKGPHWSPCGKSFDLVAESVLRLRARAKPALITIDSMDAVQRPVHLGLRWKKCQ